MTLPRLKCLFLCLALLPIFEAAGAEEGSAPEPTERPAFQRPMMEQTLFNVQGLSLDKDQTFSLATMLADMLCDFQEHPVISNPDFQTSALGLALRLDPENRTAVLVSGQLANAKPLREPIAEVDLMAVWSNLDAMVRWFHGDEATADDRILGLYLGDLTRRIQPEAGFSPEFETLHPGSASVDWSMVLPPRAEKVPPVAKSEPSEEEKTETANEGAAFVDPLMETVVLGTSLRMDTASIATLVKSGDKYFYTQPATVNLKWDEWEYERLPDPIPPNHQPERIEPQNLGPVRFSFNPTWSRLQQNWHNKAMPMLEVRYPIWPEKGAVAITANGYVDSSGSSALLPVLIGFEAMALGRPILPGTAAVGTLHDDGSLSTLSWLPDSILSHGREWSKTLIVPDSRAVLEPIARTGIISPFLSTQIIGVNTLSEAVALATGQTSPEMKSAMATFKEIQTAADKLDPALFISNRFVLDKLKEVVTAAPNHLSAAMLLVAADNQGPLDLERSHQLLMRMHAPIHQMAVGDIAKMPEKQGMEIIMIFAERWRELKPRLDPRIERYNLRLDESIRSLTEILKLKDRTTSTASLRIKAALDQAEFFRASLESSAILKP